VLLLLLLQMHALLQRQHWRQQRHLLLLPGLR
jgi:hypothetical protein